MPKIPIKKRIKRINAEGEKARAILKPLKLAYEKARSEFKDPNLIMARSRILNDSREFIRQTVFRTEKAPSIAHLLRYLQGTPYMLKISKENPVLAKTIIREINGLTKR